ncbi:hypothetical protein Vafri_6817 [Volvox africanus]|uniref:C2 domain-containing protein n=1 Tax=Volvox africanus TaxID=51714 RepID=A0A8J4EWE1_9CHLO|nr:hypothetical protein Vafri_6817 [Volvox africanus]
MALAAHYCHPIQVQSRQLPMPPTTLRGLEASSILLLRPCLAAPNIWLKPARRAKFRIAASLPSHRGAPKEGEAAGKLAHHPQHRHKFDLPLGVVMAGASFEAYLQPQGGQGFQQRSVWGATVTFTDKTFLTEIYMGVLVVELLSAANLRPADIIGLSDPYAIVTLGGSSFRSRTIPESLNPTWNEVCCMYIKDPATDILRVRLFDKDLGKSDDDLGVAMMGLGELVGTHGMAKTFTLPLRGPGAGSGGTVTLRCRLLPFADANPDDVTALTSTVTTAPSQPAVAGLQVAAAAVNAVPEELEAAMVTVSHATTSDNSRGTDDGALHNGGGDGGGNGSNFFEDAPTVALPSGEEVPNPWRVLAAMVGRAMGSESLTPVAFVENEQTDTQAWIYRNVEAREAVISFRGTEQVKWKDIATDLNLTPCSLNPERLDDNAGLPFTARIIRGWAGVHHKQFMVHKGFLDAYDSVRRTVFTLLDEITGTGNKGDNWQVVVTGHSLGGALATLAAYELADRRTPARAVQKIAMYSFGAPRVGNKAFAEEFDRLVPDAWRVTNSNDIIPSVPRLMGYCHVGHAVRLGADGDVKIGRSTAESQDAFGEGKSGVEVIGDIISKISVQARPWDEVYSEIADREMRLLDALVGGRGLEEHMETFYLASLQQAVAAQVRMEVEGE